jgi:viroplasmin and RNaseH domain-containing protein
MYYVVFVGRETGIFEHYSDVVKHTQGYTCCMFKKYPDIDIADLNYRRFLGIGDGNPVEFGYKKPKFGIAVDGGYSTKHKTVNYNAISLYSGNVLCSKTGIPVRIDGRAATIIETYAIIKAYVTAKKLGIKNCLIWTDCTPALLAIKKRELFRGETIACPSLRSMRSSINSNLKTFNIEVFKWQTKQWGVIPADVKDKLWSQK